MVQTCTLPLIFTPKLWWGINFSSRFSLVAARLSIFWLEKLWLISIFSRVKPENFLVLIFIEVFHRVEDIFPKALSDTLHVDAPYEDPEEVQWVCHDYDRIEDDISEADAYQDETQEVPRLGTTHVIAEEQ